MIVNDTRIVSGIGARQDRRHIIRQTAAGVSKGNRVALDTGDAVARVSRGIVKGQIPTTICWAVHPVAYS